MSFKPEQIRRDLIVNERSSEFWDLVHSCLEKLDLKLIEAKSQGVLIAEQDPLKFVASFIAAMDRKVPIILGNYRWGDSEWASFNREFSPAVIFGLREFAKENRPVFKEKDQENILIPTGGTSNDGFRYAIHCWESLEAQSLMVQSFLETKSINSVCCLPLFHVSGLMQVIRAIVSQGQILFCHLNDLEKASKAVVIKDFCVSLVPTQLNRLFARDAVFPKMNQFKAIFLGGGPADGLLLSKARDHTLPIVLSYGMTETAGMVCAQSQEAFLSGIFSSGKPLPGVGIKLSEKDGFKILEVYSKSLFYGYWGGQAFEKAGGFCTNDYGSFLKDGEVVIEGRVDNWIISGGEKINPKEIEDDLLASGHVESILVLGKDSKEWGQALVAIVVPKEGLNQQELIANMNKYLKQTLANHKLPKAYLLVEELPILENGKRDNHRIRELLDSVNV